MYSVWPGRWSIGPKYCKMVFRIEPCTSAWSCCTYTHWQWRPSVVVEMLDFRQFVRDGGTAGLHNFCDCIKNFYSINFLKLQLILCKWALISSHNHQQSNNRQHNRCSEWESRGLTSHSTHYTIYVPVACSRVRRCRQKLNLLKAGTGLLQILHVQCDKGNSQLHVPRFFKPQLT